MAVSLGELAVRFGCELRGDPDLRIDSVAPLGDARPGSISFLVNPRNRPQLADTRATAVVLAVASAADCPVAALIAVNPHATYARIATLLHPWPVGPPGIHSTAVVAAGAHIDPTAHVGPLVVIGAGAAIGARVFVGPHSVIDEDVVVGEDVRLVARVTLCRGTRLGARVIVQPGAVIGGDGFGFANDRQTWVKVPQIGGVAVGPDVEIGANTTIDRGAIGDTIIEEGVKLDNQIQIGHNVRIGAHSAFAACVAVAGSTTFGRRCQIGGGAGFAGHLTIADDVAVNGWAMVTHSLRKPGVYSSGFPAEPASSWWRFVARLKRSDAAAARSTGERITGARRGAPQDGNDD